MVFATREEEIDYLRDELERAGYDEGSNQKWDEATLGRVRKLRQLEEETGKTYKGMPVDGATNTTLWRKAIDSCDVALKVTRRPRARSPAAARSRRAGPRRSAS